MLTQISKGKARAVIEDEVKKQWKVSDKTISNDWTAVTKILSDRQSAFFEKIKSVIAERYEFLFDKCTEIADYKTANAILKNMAVLFGLEKEVKEIEIKDTDFQIKFE